MIVWLLLCGWGLPGQDLQQLLREVATAPDVEVSLLTCGPGKEAYNIYGHSAVRVRSRKVGVDIAFNYGTYSSFEDQFVLKFVRGKLPYRLSAADFSSFMNSYHQAGRSVIENEIQADSATLSQMVDYLRINHLPANRTYAYDFFFDNCSTRIWDLTKATTDDLLEPPSLMTNYSYRDLITLYQQYFPWLDFGIQLIIGSLADQAAGIDGQTFIPDFLHHHMRDSQWGGQPLLGPDISLLPDRQTPHKRLWWTPMVVFSLLLAVEILLTFFCNRPQLLRWYDRFWWTLLFIAGMIFTGFWIATDHQACHANYNLLWANPLILLLAVRSTKVRSVAAVVLLIGSLISLLGVFGHLPQVMPQPLSLVLSISILKLARLIKPPAHITQAIGPSSQGITTAV